jgi:hypothetical protein
MMDTKGLFVFSKNILPNILLFFIVCHSNKRQKLLLFQTFSLLHINATRLLTSVPDQVILITLNTENQANILSPENKLVLFLTS